MTDRTDAPDIEALWRKYSGVSPDAEALIAYIRAIEQERDKWVSAYTRLYGERSTSRARLDEEWREARRQIEALTGAMADHTCGARYPAPHIPACRCRRCCVAVGNARAFLSGDSPASVDNDPATHTSDPTSDKQYATPDELMNGVIGHLIGCPCGDHGQPERDQEKQIEQCAPCRGSGQISVTTEDGYGIVATSVSTCPFCGGLGVVSQPAGGGG